MSTPLSGSKNELYFGNPLLCESNTSPIKKQQLKKQHRESLRKILRESLPVLTKEEIRRFRLPYEQALIADLYDGGYISSAKFIEQLLELQARKRLQLEPGTLLWNRPQLKDSKENLNLLSDALINAEKAHANQNYALEWDEMLKLAAYYAFGSEDWWWLGEQLLYQCVSMKYPGEFQKQEAISCFMIGKYLVENGKTPENGKQYLELARHISQGKSWNCSKIFKEKQDTVYIESCRLLHKTLMEEAQVLIKTDPEKAVEICNIARKRAAECCDHHVEIEAMLLRGRCELALNRTSEAIATMTKALNRTLRRQDIQGICDAKIAMALALLQHGKLKDSYECLEDLKRIAEENNLPHYVAQAYRYMGQYYLNQQKPSEATPLLMIAFYLFHENNDLDRRDKVRTWAAISAGEELFPSFIELIRKCDSSEHGYESLMKLIGWIDGKEAFWTQPTKFTFSFSSLQKHIDETNK